jgi:hypothetical protein
LVMLLFSRTSISNASPPSSSIKLLFKNKCSRCEASFRQLESRIADLSQSWLLLRSSCLRGIYLLQKSAWHTSVICAPSMSFPRKINVSRFLFCCIPSPSALIVFCSR